MIQRRQLNKFGWKIMLVSCLDQTENQLNSSGQFSKDSSHHCRFSQNPSDLEEADINPEELSDRIIFMSMFNDINEDKRGNDTSAL